MTLFKLMLIAVLIFSNYSANAQNKSGSPQDQNLISDEKYNQTKN